MVSKVSGKKSVDEKYLHGGVCICDFLNFAKKQKYREGYKFKKVVCLHCKEKKRGKKL